MNTKDNLFNILSEKNSKFGTCNNQIDDYLYNKLIGNIFTNLNNQPTHLIKSQNYINLSDKQNTLDTFEYNENNSLKSELSKFDKMSRLETYQTELDLSTNFNNKLSGLTPKYTGDFIVTEPYFKFNESKSNIKNTNNYHNNISRTETIATDPTSFEFIENPKYSIGTPLLSHSEKTYNDTHHLVHRKIDDNNNSNMRADTCFEDGLSAEHFAANAEMAFIDYYQLVDKLDQKGPDYPLARWAIPKAQKHHTESIESLHRWYLSQRSNKLN